MDPKNTGLFISQLRKKQNLTQQEIADKIGVTRNAVSRWETGRGYPDVELLPKLAKILCSSVNEILNGSAISNPEIKTVTENNMAFVCENARKKKLLNKKIIISLCVVLSITVFISGVFVYTAFKNYADLIMGSENCIVSEDYTYLTYYGEKYVPIDIGIYSCSIGDPIVDEVKLDNATFMDKIFFGERLHAINGVDPKIMVYLFTDYDFPPSEYFVKETEYDKIKHILNNFRPDSTQAIITQKDWREICISLDETYEKIIKETEKTKYKLEEMEFSRSDGEEGIPVITYEENNIFYIDKGIFLFKDNKYFWCNYSGVENIYTDPSPTYEINSSYYNEMEKIFSYMFQ
jgi:transcriptional regulator with XRE-family HTH domain